MSVLSAQAEQLHAPLASDSAQVVGRWKHGSADVRYVTLEASETLALKAGVFGQTKSPTKSP